jgi:CspA family cold shock protein
MTATLEVTGTVKWFDPKRGFGFLVSPNLDGDVLVHRSVLQHGVGLKWVPEGAVLVVNAHHARRGYQADKVLSVDTSNARPGPTYTLPPTDGPKATDQPHGEPGPFEQLPVRWYHGLKGYGFLDRNGEDVFFHVATIRAAGYSEVWPEELVEARVAKGEKGLIAVEVRAPQAAAA